MGGQSGGVVGVRLCGLVELRWAEDCGYRRSEADYGIWKEGGMGFVVGTGRVR